jgi:hypothetical protein
MCNAIAAMGPAAAVDTEAPSLQLVVANLQKLPDVQPGKAKLADPVNPQANWFAWLKPGLARVLLPGLALLMGVGGGWVLHGLTRAPNATVQGASNNAPAPKTALQALQDARKNSDPNPLAGFCPEAGICTPSKLKMGDAKDLTVNRQFDLAWALLASALPPPASAGDSPCKLTGNTRATEQAARIDVIYRDVPTYDLAMRAKMNVLLPCLAQVSALPSRSPSLSPSPTSHSRTATRPE